MKTTESSTTTQGQNSNIKAERFSSVQALGLIFSTTNATGVEHDRINPDKVVELKKTLGRWKQPKVVTTPKGVVLEGVNYLAALAGAGNVEADIIIDRSGRAERKTLKKPSSLVESLTKAGITDAAFKLAVWRGLREGREHNPGQETAKQLTEHLSAPAFLVPFEGLKAVYDLVDTKGVAKAGRLRSKIVFAAFHLAYHANPKLVVQLYKDFLAGKAEAGSPLEKLVYAARHDNINSGSGRRPFMLKASIVLAAQLAGEKLDRAIADEQRGAQVVQLFSQQAGTA